MPELPEIETVKRGIEHLSGQTITDAIIRNHSLRYKIPSNLSQLLVGLQIMNIDRRAKYLIFKLNNGKFETSYLILHLGMSGSVTLLENSTIAINKHDHVDIVLKSGIILRYNDPRRFGCLLYTLDIENHPLLSKLGPEPLSPEFNATHLIYKLKNKTSTIKQLIMDNHIVVGVGNIYASEALFLAKISPLRTGISISADEADILVKMIKQVLIKAIELGGSSLRDYKKADGSLGYFQSIHNVYGKSGKKCNVCDSLIIEKRLGQRNSFYCPTCQK
jgi:formamidopyrimidine-DNA glycosylase